MAPWLARHLVAVHATVLILLLSAFALISVLFIQLQQARDDLERIEVGSAFFAAQVQVAIDGTIDRLEEFRTSTLEVPVQLDQQLEIETEIRIDREITVPLRTTLPIRQSFETTIQVAGPLGLALPVDVTVPLSLDVPIDVELTVPLNETIPIETSVPLQLSAPVVIDVRETELAKIVEAFIKALSAFRSLLAGMADG